MEARIRNVIRLYAALNFICFICRTSGWLVWRCLQEDF